MYEDLDDAALEAKIVELRTKLEAATGGDVVRVSGEGRTLEYGRANLGGLKTFLREAMAERDRRAGRGGRAINVRA